MADSTLIKKQSESCYIYQLSFLMLFLADLLIRYDDDNAQSLLILSFVIRCTE